MGIYKDYLNSIYDNGAGGGGDVGAPYLKNIIPTTGVKVVDENGYIGGNFLGAYYPNYYNNFAIVVPGADYSNEGLGTVVFTATETIGGRVYKTVTIGNQTWLAENLDYKFSGCGIGGSGSPTTPNAWYYNNDEETYGIDGLKKCGLLYNWYAIKLLNDNRIDLIPGWHVPTNDEWDTLVNNVGGTSVAGQLLKSIDGSIDGIWPSSWDGTDDYRFGVLPAGRYDSSGFGRLDSFAAIWSITESGVKAIYRSFTQGKETFVDENTLSYACSVRLVKDSA